MVIFDWIRNWFRFGAESARVQFVGIKDSTKDWVILNEIDNLFRHRKSYWLDSRDIDELISESSGTSTWEHHPILEMCQYSTKVIRKGCENGITNRKP